MKPEDIEKLYAATFRKPARSYCADFWETPDTRFGQERAAAQAFKNRPDFGWAIARKLATAGKTPAMLKKPECRWLRKAVVLIMAPHKVEDDPDLRAIADARDLHDDPNIRAMVQAALLTPAATVESVAGALGLEPLVIDAYEALFFNILDCRDLTYLRKAVTSRPTDQPTAYAADTGAADYRALLEAGFNGSLQEVLQLAGCARAGNHATDSPAENLMQKILAAGNAWLAGHRNPSALPPMVAQAIDIAKRSIIRTQDTPDLDHQSTGVFWELVGNQFKADVKSLEEGVARNNGFWIGDPEPKTVTKAEEAPQPKPGPIPRVPICEISESILVLGKPKHAHA